MLEGLTEVWSNFERGKIAVENPAIDNKWEYMKYQDRTFSREAFNVVVTNDKVTWQERDTYWDNAEVEAVEVSLKETLDTLRDLRYLTCTLEEEPVAEEAFGNLVAILTAKTKITNREADLADCEFFALEPLVGCGSNCSLSFGGCQCTNNDPRDVSPYVV